jgi:hypothetical protein
MESHTPVKNMEFMFKQTKNFVSFYHDGIRIPENLSKKIIKGQISTHLARKILVKEDGFYFFKFDEDYELQTSYCLRNRKYTIKFVDRSGIIFNFPILKFRNLEYDEYQEMLQILEEINVASILEIKEIKDLAHEHNFTMILYGYIFWAIFSVFARLVGIGLYDYLSGNERVVIDIYTIITLGSFAYNTLMCILVGLKRDPSDIEKMRKLLILQYIQGLFVVLVISVVFAFALTR